MPLSHVYPGLLVVLAFVATFRIVADQWSPGPWVDLAGPVPITAPR